jgi:hypothetical protein
MDRKHDFFSPVNIRNNMPELPDIVVYIEALKMRILDQRLLRARIAHPFLLRTAEPPVSAKRTSGC